MRSRKKGSSSHGLLPLTLTASLLLSGCLLYPEHDGNGYDRSHDRHQKQGVVRFDSSLGVYVVVGHPDHYYYGNTYYRYQRDRDRWYSSRHLDRDWREYRGDLPRGLAERYRHDERSKRGHSWRRPSQRR